MIHSDLKALAAANDDVVAVWQLMERGWTASAVEHRTRGLRRLHDGVMLLGHAEPTTRQRMRAATLTAPNTWIGHESAGTTYEMGTAPLHGRTSVVRRGDGGPRLYDGLLVRHSVVLHRHTTWLDGIPTLRAERVLVDLAPKLSDRALRKAFREAVRGRHTTAQRVRRLTLDHPHRRGSRRVGELAEVYVRLPIGRCRSDAEARALEILDRAGVAIPEVNRRIAGEEADLCWPGLRLIIEIDGPQYHRFKDEDARKTAVWRSAGYTVLRISSDAVFDNPELLLQIAPRTVA